MQFWIRPTKNVFLAAWLALACSSSTGDDAVDSVDSSVTIDANATYTLVGIQSNKCVQIEGAATTNLARAEIATCNGSRAQQFRIQPAANAAGFFTIRNVNSNLCLDVEGVSTADGARIIQWTCGSGQNQQWSFADVTGGARIAARHSGKQLEVPNNATADGTDLRQWPNLNQTNQHFRLSTGSGGGSGGSGGGTAGSGGAGGSGATGSGATGSGATGSGATSGNPPGACVQGSSTTAWATSCANAPPRACTPGTWTAWGSSSPENYPFRYETAHFAFYWPDGRNVTLAQAEAAGDYLENVVWRQYFGSPIFFQEPDCTLSAKRKTSIHIIENGLFGGCNNGRPGIWVGPGALADRWGLAHEFAHAVQCGTPGFQDCGGAGCWINESHANWMAHQLSIHRNEPHCSDMLVNAPHLYYGSTRDRYCNWQLFEFLKDKHCYKAVNDLWSASAPAGQRDPWNKLALNMGWNAEQVNDLFGEWATHNVTWDYKDPPPTAGASQGATYRSRYAPITDESRPERRLRLTALEPQNASWASNRRFQSPYFWAPQRWGYNVVRLFPEAGATSVTVTFRGVTQGGTSSGWRWALVATDAGLTTSRYSPLQRGADGQLTFCITPGESVFLVVTAAPTVLQKIVWDQAYPSIHRYPYMVELRGAWPEGFRNGQLDACPSGTQRHANGGGCAPASLPASVFVGPYAQVLGGNVSGSARVEDHATVLNGATVSGGTVSALSVIMNGFNVSGSARTESTFYPLGFFEAKSVSGTARLYGDLEYRSAKSSGSYYGFVEANTTSATIADVTTPPPYAWR